MVIEEIELEIFRLGIVPDVLSILHDREQAKRNSEDVIVKPKIYPKKWEKIYENWLYERGGKVPSCYEFKFEWKRFLGNFVTPSIRTIKESGLVGSFFRGVGKAEIWLRVEPKEEAFVFHLEFLPYKRHVGKLHNNLSFEEAKEIIREYVHMDF